MKYELINENLISPITNISYSKEIEGISYNFTTSNPTDEMLDELNIGMYLDESTSIPTYDSSTHYLQIYYSISDGKIIRDYEVLEIVPSEIDKLKVDMINSMNAITEVFEMML